MLTRQRKKMCTFKMGFTLLRDYNQLDRNFFHFFPPNFQKLGSWTLLLLLHNVGIVHPQLYSGSHPFLCFQKVSACNYAFSPSHPQCLLLHLIDPTTSTHDIPPFTFKHFINTECSWLSLSWHSFFSCHHRHFPRGHTHPFFHRFTHQSSFA